MRGSVSNNQNFNLREQYNQYKTFMKGLPRQIGNEHVNFAKQSFRRGGFIQDSRVDKWKERKTNKNRRSSTRAILVKTGRLRRSIRITQIGSTFVRVGSDVPYAAIHNEGGTIEATATVSAHTRRMKVKKNVYNISTRRSRRVSVDIGNVNISSHTRNINTTMPRRQYMGPSRFFNKRIMMIISYEMRTIFKAA